MNTFDQIRLQYIKNNPLPSLPKEIQISDRLTSVELIEKLKKEGIDFSDRNLTYYQKLGLIDKPLIAHKREGKGKAGYFHKDTFDRIKEIKKYQANGYSLDVIKNKLLTATSPIAISDGGKKINVERLRYFKELIKLLIKNVPQKVDNHFLIHYLSLIDTEESQEKSRLFADLINENNKLKTKLFKILIKSKIEPYVNKQIDKILEDFIEKYYFEIMGGKIDSEVNEIITLKDANLNMCFLVGHLKFVAGVLSQIKDMTLVVAEGKK